MKTYEFYLEGYVKFDDKGRQVYFMSGNNLEAQNIKEAERKIKREFVSIYGKVLKWREVFLKRG